MHIPSERPSHTQGLKATDSSYSIEPKETGSILVIDVSGLA